MHNYRVPFITLLVVLITSLGLAAWSQDALTYSNSELDELLAPIALYPDPLIAQILPAATFPDELADADDFVGPDNNTSGIDDQDWDVSVKAVAYYPSVLHMMVDKPDWTTAVGQAYVDEPDHVMRAIQRLRQRARSHGYLSPNRYQSVYVNQGYIYIVPVQPQYIYVPQYDPQVVYIQDRSSYNSNALSFGLGFLIGSWLNRDVDWHHDRVFYHGWHGGGWIGRSRSHVRITNNYYVSNDYRNRPIRVDRNVRHRDLGDYRTRIRSNAGTFSPPDWRRSNRSNADRNGNTSFGRTPRVRTPRSNDNRSQGGTSRTWTGRGDTRSDSNTPRVRTPRSNDNQSQGRSPQAWTGRRDTPSDTNTPRVRTPRSNDNQSQGRSPQAWTGRRDTPSDSNRLRSDRSNNQSIGRSGQDRTKSRESNRSDHGRSDSKSNGKEHDKSKDDSKGH